VLPRCPHSFPTRRSSDLQTEMAGTLMTEPVELAGGAPLPAHLPPLPRPQQGPFTRVANAIADEVTGLPTPLAAAQWETRPYRPRSEEHTSELQSRENLVC